MTEVPANSEGADQTDQPAPTRPLLEPGYDEKWLRDRIAVLPGDDRIAYRPGVIMVELPGVSDGQDILKPLKDAMTTAGEDLESFDVERVFENVDGAEAALGIWIKVRGLTDAPKWVEFVDQHGLHAHLDLVYFASGSCRCGCPPHPAAAAVTANPWTANPWTANPWTANPWTANPWTANPWTANPWTANPWTANPEALNVAVTGKPPTSSAMPALEPQILDRGDIGSGVTVGVLDSGLVGDVTHDGHVDEMRPKFLVSSLINGEIDLPSAKIKGRTDRYLDPVAGHGTFIAGIIKERAPGCKIQVNRVFFPEGDVSTSWLAKRLWILADAEKPSIVNLSFGGPGSTADGLFEVAIRHFHKKGIVFVAAAGNEGTCVEQFPAALPEVIAVAALSPNGPAPWSNYGPWVDACAPGTDLVSSFFANFDGEMPPINGIDPDNFDGWATWSGTSFAAPVVVAALAREIATTGCTAKEAVQRVIDSPHLARIPNMGTIVNY